MNRQMTSKKTGRGGMTLDVREKTGREQGRGLVERRCYKTMSEV